MIKIIQMICPEKHLMMCMSYDDTLSDFALSCFEMGIRAASKKISYVCRTCGSQKFIIMDTPTNFATLAECEKVLDAVGNAAQALKKIREADGTNFRGQQRHKN